MRSALGLVFCVAAGGCATAPPAIHHQPHDGRPAPTPAPVPPGVVILFATDRIGRPTEVLGVVDAHTPSGEQDAALAALKAHAAELGADAVIGVEFHHGDGGARPVHVSGLAVRFRDLVQGRRFEVVAQLEAHAPMGREEDAREELKRQAREVRADLILNVRLHHGEDGAPSIRMTGRAIQFR